MRDEKKGVLLIPHPSSLSSMRESNLSRRESGGDISGTLNPIAVTTDSNSARTSPAPLLLSIKSASNARASRSSKAPSAKSAARACISSCLSFGSNGAHLRDRMQEAGGRRQEAGFITSCCLLLLASCLLVIEGSLQIISYSPGSVSAPHAVSPFPAWCAF